MLSRTGCVNKCYEIETENSLLGIDQVDLKASQRRDLLTWDSFGSW